MAARDEDTAAGTGTAAAPVVVHVVPHTHWDREWYLPAGRFRQWLVELVDELVERPDKAPPTFLLDGQMVVLDDYLDVRPERADVLGAMLQDGRLEAGPWYVLADELIPGAEALVRNLQAGRRALDRMGAAAPAVLYCPDSFGHPAAMPMLAAGFGFDLTIASRGFGGSRWPTGDAVRWHAADGSTVVLYHLSRRGYDIGENLPADPVAARARWADIASDLVGRSRLGVVLLPNGADHHALQRDAAAAIRQLAMAAAPHDVRASSLGAFARDVVRAAQQVRLPEIHGELRDSHGYVWTLGGTLATRAHQKRRNAQLERLLVRDVEPWAALAVREGHRSRAALVNAAWRSLLLCHPHDTLCGCSTDEVARAMDARLDDAESQGAGIRDDAILDLIGHDRDRARTRKADWRPQVVIRNAAARPRAGVALLRLTTFRSDVKVGANASPGPVETAPRTTPVVAGAVTQQVLRRWSAPERTEAPRHYPDNDLVDVCEVAAWFDDPVPGYGVVSQPQRTRGRRTNPPDPVRADGLSIANTRVTVSVDADGRVSFVDREAGVSIDSLLVWESRTDLGDLYTPSLRERRLAASFRGARVRHRGPVRGAIETRWRLAAGRERIDVTVTVALDAGAPFVRLSVAGENTVCDHRLRLGVATGLSKSRVVADAMFGPVERRPIVVTDDERRFEAPLPTAPLHRYVSLHGAKGGATVFSDGLAEYEERDGVVFVTLCRSVGELSRNDLPERPGHAGWPTPTPEAQCPGPFAAELALLAHAPASPDTMDLIERTADDVLLPLTGATLRSAIDARAPAGAVALSGTGLAVSSITLGQDGSSLVLRCVNLTEAEQPGAWTVTPAPATALLARLDETPIRSLAVSGTAIAFLAPPRAVVTILVR